MMTIDNFDQTPLNEADTLKMCQNGAGPDWAVYPPFTFKTGQWYHIEVEYILNTPGVSNGILRAWIDGALKIEQTNIPFRKTTYQMEGFVFGINYSNSCCGGWKATGPIYKYFDDIYVAAGYTGPAPELHRTKHLLHHQLP